MRGLDRFAALALPLLLAACWTGKPFYAAHETVVPIPAGVYEVEPNESSARGRVRVSVRPDGRTAFVQPDGDTTIAGFAPLPGREGMFVAWFSDSEQKGSEDLWYGLLEKSGPDFRLGIPMCKETRSIAASAGAQFQPDPKVPVCDFPDRASLEAGLRRVAVEGPMEFSRLVPAGRDGAGD